VSRLSESLPITWQGEARPMRVVRTMALACAFLSTVVPQVRAGTFTVYKVENNDAEECSHGSRHCRDRPALEVLVQRLRTLAPTLIVVEAMGG